MSRNDSEDTFNAAIEALRESARAHLSPDLRNLFARHIQERQSTGAADPAQAFEDLSRLISLSTQPCSEKVRLDVGIAILAKTSLVDVFFGHLPTPEEHEKGHVGLGIITVTTAYKHAQDVLKHLRIVYGKNSMNKQRRDPILSGLLMLLDRKGSLASDGFKFLGLEIFRPLLFLAWRIRDETNIREKYNAHTHRLMEYLWWVILGRKDSSCQFEKPWSTVDLADLRRTAASDLSRLPGDPARHAALCPETTKLFRLARLFQVAFEQFLLSRSYKTAYSVSADPGFVRVNLASGDFDKFGLNLEAMYLGKSPDLDLTQPKVRAALHAFACCAIEDPARALLELFFRDSCATIQFLTFVPKNAHTVVLEYVEGQLRFNMEPYHTVAILTTKSGLQFVLDPTAAQYGWVENLAPMEAYARCRIDCKLTGEICDPSAGASTPMDSTPEETSERELWTARLVAGDVKDFVEDHFMINDGLDCILRLAQSQFDEHCLTMGEFLKEGMRLKDRERDSNEE